MRLTIEREYEIRNADCDQLYENYDKYIGELLTEIDALRAEIARYADITERDGKDYSDILKERDQIKERVAKLREALKKIARNEL